MITNRERLYRLFNRVDEFGLSDSLNVNNLAGRHNFKGGYQWNKLFNDVDQGFFNKGRIDFRFNQTDRGFGGGPPANWDIFS